MGSNECGGHDERADSGDSGRSNDGWRDHADDSFDAEERSAEEVAGFTTYVNDEYVYTVATPAGWSVEAEPSGDTAFEAGASSAGATVFVDEHRDDSLREYVEAFLDELRADESIASLEVVARRDTTVQGGHAGHVLECTYLGDAPDDRWHLSYLFVRVGDVGYTVGVDWRETEAREAVATQIIDSFAVEAGEASTG